MKFWMTALLLGVPMGAGHGATITKQLLGFSLGASTKASRNFGASTQIASSKDGNNEALKYFKFLTKLSNDVENIIILANSKTNEKIVAETPTKLDLIRNQIIDRRSDLRQNVIQTNPTEDIEQDRHLSEFEKEILKIFTSLVEKFASPNPGDLEKQLMGDLIELRDDIEKEKKRILSFDVSSSSTTTQCFQCEDVENLRKSVSDLVDCANQLKQDCQYTSFLISAKAAMDKEISKLAASFRTAAGDQEKIAENTKRFLARKNIRNSLDTFQIETNTEKDFVLRSLGHVKTVLEEELAECRESCPNPVAPCDHCGSEVLTTVKSNIDLLRSRLTSPGINVETSEIRTELIGIAKKRVSQKSDILRLKAKGNLEKCKKEQLEALEFITPKLWDLVEFVEQTKMDEVIQEIDSKQNAFCPTAGGGSTQTCEGDEYEQSNAFIAQVDKFTQDQHQGRDQQALENALLGLVDIKDKFSTRMVTLIEDVIEQNRLRCPDEENRIDEVYMPKLKECITEFHKYQDESFVPKFSDLTWGERVECVQDLRRAIQDRKDHLLRSLPWTNEAPPQGVQPNTS